MGVCNCSMFCCTLLYVHSSLAIILMGKRELIALLNLSSWCLVMVERLFLAVPWGCLQFVIVVFPDHTKKVWTDGMEGRRQNYIPPTSSGDKNSTCSCRVCNAMHREEIWSSTRDAKYKTA